MTITTLGELYSSKNSRNTVRVGKRLIDAMVRAQILPDDDAKNIIPVFVP